MVGAHRIRNWETVRSYFLSPLGPIVRINTFQVDINDHHSAKEIHKTHSPFVKGKLYRMFISNNIENIFSTADQQFHASRRRLLASAMSDSSLTRHEPLVHMKASMAVDGITRELKARGVSDVFKWWLFLATDVIGELSFGESFQMLEAGEVGKYESLTASVTDNILEKPIFYGSRTDFGHPALPGSLP